MHASIELGKLEVKTLRRDGPHQNFSHRLEVNLSSKRGSGRWGTGRSGHWGVGGAETRGGHPAASAHGGWAFAGRSTVPESTVIVRGDGGGVDRPSVQLVPVRTYFSFAFERFSLKWRDGRMVALADARPTSERKPSLCGSRSALKW